MGGRMIPKDISAAAQYYLSKHRSPLLDSNCTKTPMLAAFCAAPLIGTNILKYVNNSNRITEEGGETEKEPENFQKDMNEEICINIKPCSSTSNKNYYIINKSIAKLEKFPKTPVMCPVRELTHFNLRNYLLQVDKNNNSPFPH
jgi:hypothetical protein